MMSVRNYYFLLIGFKIKVIFFSPKNILKFPLEKEILRFYSNFLIKKTKKYDFKINFFLKKIEIFSEKKIPNIYSTHLFLFNKENSELKTFTSISLPQFNEILFRFVLSFLLEKNYGFFLHAAANIFKNSYCLIFLGKSSSGKSTISSISQKTGYPSIADDGVFIRPIFKKNKIYYRVLIFNLFEKKEWLYKFKKTFKKEKRKIIYQSFFRIKKIFLLKKSSKNTINLISNKKKYLSKIIKNYYPIGYFDRKNSFSSFLNFIKNNNFFLFEFKKTTKFGQSIIRKI